MAKPRPVNPRDPHGDPEGIVLDPKQLLMSASSVLLAKRIGDTLERLYPGWLWAIEVDERGGVTNLKSLRLSGQWGWRMKTKDIQDDPKLRRVVMGAGELLERFGQKRGRYNLDAWRAQPRKYGLLDFDISDKAARIQKRRRDEDFSAAIKSGRLKLLIEDQKTASGTHRALYLKNEPFAVARDNARKATVSADRALIEANRRAHAR